MNQIARVYQQPIQEIERQLAAYEPQIVEALPPGVTFDRFKAVALAAINRSMGSGDWSDLVTADRNSLFSALVEAAGSGLLPDGKEGALVRRKRQVAWMPMVQGIAKLARNSGLVSSIVTGVAYKGERLEVYAGNRQEIVHVVDLDAVDTGEVRAAYAIAKLRNPDGSVGDRVAEVMTKKQIDKVKEISSAGDKGPWGKWYGEMARKTALHRLFKSLPRDTDDKLLRAVYSVEAEYDFGERKAAPAKGPTIEGERAADFAYIDDQGEEFLVNDIREWCTSWEAVVDRAAEEKALDRLRADWDRNLDVFNALKRGGYKDAVSEVEDEIRVVLGMETPESTGRGGDFVERMQEKYAKLNKGEASPPPPADDREQAKTELRKHDPELADQLDKAQAKKAAPEGGEGQPQQPSAGAGVPWLDYDENNKIVVRSAASAKELIDGVWGVLCRIGANGQWIADYEREMRPHIESIRKFKNGAKIAVAVETLFEDARKRARSSELAKAGR